MASIKMFSSASAKEEKYEVDSRVAAVDAYANSHLVTPTSNPYHATLEHAYSNSVKQGLPDIAVSLSQGHFLAIQARVAQAKNILEIGTLGGYSTIWLASWSPDAKVTTIEVDPHHKTVADANIAHAGLADRITVHLGPALTILPHLRSSIQSGQSEPFDFVFVDADKENNLAYFDLALQMVKPGTCIYVDNVVRQGKLADAQNTDPRVIGSRELVEAVGRKETVVGTVIQTVGEKNYDGFLMAVVK